MLDHLATHAKSRGIDVLRLETGIHQHAAICLYEQVKRQRSVDCLVIGLAGETATPKLVLALRHADGRLHHLGRLGVSSVVLTRDSLRDLGLQPAPECRCRGQVGLS